MKVRVGIAESSKVVELEVDDGAAFEAKVEEAFHGESVVVWFEDTKQHRVGVPRDKIAFIEVEMAADRTPVGFGS